jgi:hypothetical protein
LGIGHGRGKTWRDASRARLERDVHHPQYGAGTHHHDYTANKHARTPWKAPVRPHPRDLLIAYLVERHRREDLSADGPDHLPGAASLAGHEPRKCVRVE